VRWRALAPGKLNLCLFVGAPRQDGYHPLVSVVEPVSLADELVLEPAPADCSADEVVCPGVPGKNLAARALALFRDRTGWDAPAVRLTIVKRVPIAAGMGGGSTDAAAALRLAAAAAGLAADDPALAGIAPALGADVPSLLSPGRCLMTGVGEIVEPLAASGDSAAFVIVPVAAALATPAVYAEFDRLSVGRAAGELADLAAAVRSGTWTPGNDLEAPASAMCAAIEPARAAARAAGAEFVLVSGSGPTVFGGFSGPEADARARAAAGSLRDRFPSAVAARPVDAGFAAPAPLD
jgi:4-diphosphocytidyl-2-C-methyl-D-erythritol kinase